MGLCDLPFVSCCSLAGLLEQHPDFTKDWLLNSADVEYDPEKAIGAGGFAQVFRGKYQGQDVAVKVIHQNLLDNEERWVVGPAVGDAPLWRFGRSGWGMRTFFDE